MMRSISSEAVSIIQFGRLQVCRSVRPSLTLSIWSSTSELNSGVCAWSYNPWQGPCARPCFRSWWGGRSYVDWRVPGRSRCFRYGAASCNIFLSLRFTGFTLEMFLSKYLTIIISLNLRILVKNIYAGILVKTWGIIFSYSLFQILDYTPLIRNQQCCSKIVHTLFHIVKECMTEKLSGSFYEYHWVSGKWWMFFCFKIVLWPLARVN